MLVFLERTATANLARLDRLKPLSPTPGAASPWPSRPGSMVHKLVPSRPDFARAFDADATGARSYWAAPLVALSTAALRLVEAGVLTTPDATAPDPLFEAPAVLDIFDRFRAGVRGGGLRDR